MTDPIASTMSRSRLAQIAVARAVQQIEQAGPLDDGEAMRAAFAAGNDREQRLLARAWHLGQRLGLDRAWARWRQLGGWVVLGLAALVVLGAWSLAQLVLGESRQVNAVAAFVSLLGLHALTLLAWCLGLLLPWPTGGGALGRSALVVTARLPLDRGPHAIELLRATTEVLRRARLAPWAFGGISHTIWALSFTVLLAGLAFAFSLRAYRLTWETTILTPEFFVQFVRATGWLPSQLGFALPDAASLLRPDAPGADHRAWAWWLIGCVAVYGWAVRVLCALLSWGMWRQGGARLRLDLVEPYHRRLLARFDAMEPAVVVDAEQRAATVSAVATSPRIAVDPAARAVIGFELPPESTWPPFEPAAGVAMTRIEGSQEERASVLQHLAATRPGRLLVVCQGTSSPDRGTARFLREASGDAGLCRVLLTGALRGADTARWRAWLHETELAQRIALDTDAAAASAWITSP